ncbi:MAG TPA: sugar dehydrogenase complex small subunit [Caldilineaceae bacterium]|nr:sugar dehydrogenase complex small subunit [Caldilineaceae bacterium]
MTPTQFSQPGMSRRAFLRGITISLSGLVVLACGPARGGEEIGQRLALGPHATPPVVLPSPMPAAATATPAPLLQEFLALSSLLTGVAELEPELGRIYLQSLQRTEESQSALQALWEEAGFQRGALPTSLAALEERNMFGNEEIRNVTNRIIEMWYTGIYTDDAGEDVVATYVDALAWRTLRFTKPKTICGEPGFWAQEWRPEHPTL